MSIDGSKKRTLIMFAALCVIVIGLIAYMYFNVFSSGCDEDCGAAGLTVELPDGDVAVIEGSKSAAYRGVRSVSASEYFAELEILAQDNDASMMPEYVNTSKLDETIVPDGSNATERVFGVTSSCETVPSCVKGNDGHSKIMSADEKLDYDRKRAEMVRDVIVGTSYGCGNEQDVEESLEPVVFSVYGTDDGIVCTLDDDISYNIAGHTAGIKRPYRCMFVKEGKVRNGQRVMIRLLENYEADGIRIPANTHLSAICKVTDRLELSVRSFENNGRIVSLALQAYDMDGLLGIYCPETSVSKNSRKASDDAVTLAGSALGGFVGNIANTVIRTGASVVKSISGEVSVNVASGYEFFLVKSEKI